MMTTTKLSASDADSFDYLIIGGGTAGCVIASRLAEYLPKKRILLIEAGPSDFMNDKILNLKDWLNLLGGELDYDYGTTEQPNGKPKSACAFSASVYASNVVSFVLPLESKHTNKTGGNECAESVALYET